MPGRRPQAGPAADGAAEPWTGEPGVWAVRSGDTTCRVRLDPDDDQAAMCTCTWCLHHGGGRGVCKHALAVRLSTQGRAEV